MQRLPFSAIRTRSQIEIGSSASLFMVSPSGRKLAAFGGKQILIADLHTNRIVAKVPIQYEVAFFDFNESESLLFVEEESGKFFEVFSAEKGFCFLRREAAEDLASAWLFSPRLNLMCIKDFNKKKFELLSILPKKSLNFSMDFDSHRHVLDEPSGSLIFRHSFRRKIEVLNLKTLTSHEVVDSINARFFVLTSDKEAIFVHNFHRIQLIDYHKDLILRDFHLNNMLPSFSWVVVRPRGLMFFNCESKNLNQFYLYSQKNNEKIRMFQTPLHSTMKVNSFKRIERKGVFIERDEEGNCFVQEVELGNVCGLMPVGQDSRRLIKLRMSLEHRSFEIKRWKPRRLGQSKIFLSVKN